MKVQNLTDKVTQFQEKTNVEFKQQMKINDTHEKLLSKHSHELESTQNQLSVMNTMQTNEACRITGAIKEITNLSQLQMKSTQQLEETRGQVSVLEKNFSHIQQHLEETTSNLIYTLCIIRIKLIVFYCIEA